MKNFQISSDAVGTRIERESQQFDGGRLKDILVEIGLHYNQYSPDLSNSIEEAYTERHLTCYLPTFTALNWAMNRGYSIGISVNKRAHPIAFIETPQATYMFDYLANDDPVRMKEYSPGRSPQFVRIEDKRQLIATIKIFDALEEVMGLSETGQEVDFGTVDSLDFTNNGYFGRLARKVAANPL